MTANELNEKVRVQANVEYASHPGLSLVGDLYMPAEPRTPSPEVTCQ
jgi:hypothetical protein